MVKRGSFGRLLVWQFWGVISVVKLAVLGGY